MPIEVHDPTSTTPSVLDFFEEVNRSETPDETLFWFANGRESLAASLDAALLQKIWMEAAQHLFIEPATATLIHPPLGMNLFPVLLDVSCLKQAASLEMIPDDREQRRFATKLWTSLEEYPVEDGMAHSIERIIAEELRSANYERALGWLRSFCTDVSRPSFAASVLRCLGRHHDMGTVSWRLGLVRDGLTIDNVEIRDAAVQAAESWGDLDSLDVLRSHSEPEPWLRQYILDVIDDLTG